MIPARSRFGDLYLFGGISLPSQFLEGLRTGGAASVVRVDCYETTLGSGGPERCTAEAEMLQRGEVDAILFSSTAEAQGLCLLLGGKQAVRDSVLRHGVVLAAHGPYTARGVQGVLDLEVPVVGRDFSSFAGVVDALEQHYRDASSTPEGSNTSI